jgi:hypothetical protein
MSTEQMIADAVAAVEHAGQVRAYHRRTTRKGGKQREADLDLAMTRLKDAMAPLRRVIARFPYEQPSPSQRALIEATSQALQAERRKLWKMTAKKTRSARRQRNDRLIIK